MKLPFTIDEFLEVFRKYNTTFFPAQIVLLMLAALVIYLVIKNNKNSVKIVTIVLAVFWLWMGIAYHLLFFSVINKAAYAFAALFILQGILLLNFAVKAGSFSFHRNIASFFSAVLLIYALIIYPLLGYFEGHAYPYSPTFGLPCPTTIFTLAIFLLSEKRMPWYIVVIPLLWTVIGFSAAFTFGIYEDTALIISGLLCAVLHFSKPKHPNGKIGMEGFAHIET
jgi:hypothetical protein